MSTAEQWDEAEAMTKQAFGPGSEPSAVVSGAIGLAAYGVSYLVLTATRHYDEQLVALAIGSILGAVHFGWQKLRERERHAYFVKCLEELRRRRSEDFK